MFNSRAGLASLVTKPPNGQGAIRRFIGPKLFLFAIAVAFICWLQMAGLLNIDNVLRYRDSHPAAAALIFIGVYALSVVISFPTLPLNVAAGALWGPILGGIIAVVGMTLGATVAFASARSVFGQPLAQHFDSHAVSWLQKEFDVQGWRFIAFLRLNPVFPAGPLNYVLGLTSIGIVTFVWSTVVFLLPPGIAVAFIGHSMGALLDQRTLQNGIRAAMLISAAATVLITLRYAAKYFTSRQPHDNDSSRSNAE